MKKDERDELSHLILKLTRGIAEANRTHSSARMGDVIWLRKGKSKATYPHQVDQLHLGRDSGTWVIIERDTQLWNEVVSKLHMPRRTIISRQFVETELASLVEDYRSKGWKLQGIQKDIDRLIKNIAAERGEETTFFLPIVGLVLKVQKFDIGDVEFLDRTKIKDIDDTLQELENDLGKYPEFSVPKTIAVTKASGDIETALQNARRNVNQALNMFRVFKYPTVEKRRAPLRQIGIMGEYPASVSYYSSKSSVANQSNKNAISELGGYSLSGAGEIDVTNSLLNALFGTGFDKLSRLLTSRSSKFESSLLRAAEWLGEATKPDRLETKFLKVAFAIDAMVGEEASENIPDKGTTARIAERSAFLLSNKGTKRKEIYDDMRELIKKRNSLAHGGSDEVNESETERFGTYARTLLARLLKLEPQFKSSEELARWVQWQAFKG